MEIIISYYTSAGNMKKINQDSLSIELVNSPQGQIVFAIICDGMGGMDWGELASKEVVMAFQHWFTTWFAKMVAEDSVTEDGIYNQWQKVIRIMNNRLHKYANDRGKRIGTTLSLLLIYKREYFICHVGDSQIYQITETVNKITQDHTLVAWEMKAGRITEAEALADPRRSILLQCVGASDVIQPQYEKGDITGAVSFVLSSDGFIHMISKEEIYQYFSPEVLTDKEQAGKNCKKATHLVMERGEMDNITVIVIAVK